MPSTHSALQWTLAMMTGSGHGSAISLDIRLMVSCVCVHVFNCTQESLRVVHCIHYVTAHTYLLIISTGDTQPITNTNPNPV